MKKQIIASLLSIGMMINAASVSVFAIEPIPSADANQSTTQDYVVKWYVGSSINYENTLMLN